MHDSKLQLKVYVRLKITGENLHVVVKITCAHKGKVCAQYIYSGEFACL